MSTTCESDKCNNDATVRYFWPGNLPRAACAEHAGQAARVAEAMGLLLPIEPLFSPRAWDMKVSREHDV